MVLKDEEMAVAASSQDIVRVGNMSDAASNDPYSSLGPGDRLENPGLQDEDGPSNKRKNIKWGQESNVLLISGWLNTSKGLMVGNYRTGSTYWDRIAYYFNTNRKRGEHKVSGKQCKDHWNKINPKIVSFNKCYERVQQVRHISWSNEQVIENARQMYTQENKNSNFAHVYCWRLLKDEPKWYKAYQSEYAKKSKVLGPGANTPSLNQDISDEVREVHPTGQKSPKGKGIQDNDTTFMETQTRKAVALEKLVTIREKEVEDNRMKQYMDYLVMDTLHMTPEQKKDYENMCAYIKKNILKF